VYVTLSAEANACVYIYVCLSMHHIDSSEVDIRGGIYMSATVAVCIYIFVMYVYIYKSSTTSTLLR